MPRYLEMLFRRRYSRGEHPKLRRKSPLKEVTLSKPTSRQTSVTLCSPRSRSRRAFASRFRCRYWLGVSRKTSRNNRWK